MVKIQLIAAGILRKNSKFVHQYEKAVNRSDQLAQLLKHAAQQMKILKLHVNIDKPHTYYRLNKSQNDKIKKSNNTVASIIADALLREDYAVQLVARSHGNNLELEKNWDLISNLEKDDLKSKEFFRDI